MNSINYLPDFLKDVEEFKQLCLIYDSFGDGAQTDVDALVANETPNTATLAGLQRWAEIQGLTDYENDDIDTLRGKVILKFSEKVPFTVIKFWQTLVSILGANTFWLDMDTAFVMDVHIQSALTDRFESVRQTCETMLPMNVHYSITPYDTNKGYAYMGGAVATGQTVTLKGDDVA